MPESWQLDQDEDVECPLPGEFWHIEFIDGTFDRITKQQADDIIADIKSSSKWLWATSLSGSKIFINLSCIAFIGQNNAEIRRVDRQQNRWLTREVKKDPYLKSVADDE